MIAILVIIALLCLWGIRFAGFHEDYCGTFPLRIRFRENLRMLRAQFRK